MMIIAICPGVVKTVEESPRQAFLEAARRALESAGYKEPVLLRNASCARWGLQQAWWAVGPSSAGTLAEHPELAGPREHLKRRNEMLVIYTDRPGAWIGKGGTHVHSLANTWQVPVLVTTLEGELLRKVTRPWRSTLGGRLPRETGLS